MYDFNYTIHKDKEEKGEEKRISMKDGLNYIIYNILWLNINAHNTRTCCFSFTSQNNHFFSLIDVTQNRQIRLSCVSLFITESLVCTHTLSIRKTVGFIKKRKHWLVFTWFFFLFLHSIESFSFIIPVWVLCDAWNGTKQLFVSLFQYFFYDFYFSLAKGF